MNRWLHHVRCVPRGRLSNEEGIALIAVMGVMGVLLLVVAWVASGATHVSETTNTDRGSKRALAAAEAGLAVATERLNRTSLLPGQCLTNSGASANGTGECTAPTASEAESMGNNTSQRFLVSREVGPTTGCTTGHVVPAGFERCITAVGRANGVERRLLRPVQTRAPIFGEAGVIGLNGLHFINSVEVGSQSAPMTFGTNGQVTMGNSIKAYGTFLMPASAPAISVCSGCGSGWTRTTRAEEWELPALDPALDRAWAVNQNASLSSSLYNSTTKRFSLNGTATINGGTYVFCDFDVRDNSKLSITSGQSAKIYVDSPLRAASPCPDPTSGQGRGRLTVDDSAELNVGGAASRLQFYVAGTGAEADNPNYPCSNGPYKDDVVLCNSVKLHGTIFAPRSTVYLVNSVEMGDGAVAGANVVFGNSIKIGLSGFSGNVTMDVLENRRWFECKAVPSTSSDPESGCTAP